MLFLFACKQLLLSLKVMFVCVLKPPVKTISELLRSLSAQRRWGSS